MSKCKICWVVIPPNDPNDPRERPWCITCKNYKNANYYDLRIREPSVLYLDQLARTRSGRQYEDTIMRIKDILSRHPEKQSDLPKSMYLHDCPECHIIFCRHLDIVSRYDECAVQYNPVCARCENSFVAYRV